MHRSCTMFMCKCFKHTVRIPLGFHWSVGFFFAVANILKNVCQCSEPTDIRKSHWQHCASCPNVCCSKVWPLWSCLSACDLKKIKSTRTSGSLLQRQISEDWKELLRPHSVCPSRHYPPEIASNKLSAQLLEKQLELGVILDHCTFKNILYLGCLFLIGVWSEIDLTDHWAELSCFKKFLVHVVCV